MSFVETQPLCQGSGGCKDDRVSAIKKKIKSPWIAKVPKDARFLRQTLDSPGNGGGLYGLMAVSYMTPACTSRKIHSLLLKQTRRNQALNACIKKMCNEHHMLLKTRSSYLGVLFNSNPHNRGGFEVERYEWGQDGEVHSVAISTGSHTQFPAGRKRPMESLKEDKF